MKISLRTSVFFGSVAQVIALALTLALSSVAPAHAKTFTFRVIGDPETLDWNRAHTPVENYLMINLMEGLVTLDEKLEVKPALAESWTKSSDGRIYTFQIRKNAKWSDGVPLKAADFVTSWKRVLSPATGAAYAYFLFDIKNAEEFYKGKIKDFTQVGVKALSDHTLQVTLARPVAHWKYIPSFWITFPLREDILKKYGKSWAQPGKMVTVGPYKLDSYAPDSKVVMSANPHYYGVRGNIDQAVGLIVKDDATALSLFEAGQLQYATDIPALDLARLSGTRELNFFPYLKTGYMGLVHTQPGMDNPKVRQAIAMSIDKSNFGKLLLGKQKAASAFVPPQMLGHEPVGLKFDPKKAKLLLKESGVKPETLSNLKICIPNSDRAVTLAQYIQAQLKTNLGIQVGVQPFDNKTFRSQIDLKAFPMFILSWGADYPDPDNFLSMWLSDSGNNRTGWKNSEYDQMIVKARTLQSDAARRALYSKAQKLLLEKDAVIIPLYYDTNIALVSSKVKGLDVNPINYFYIRKANIGE